MQGKIIIVNNILYTIDSDNEQYMYIENYKMFKLSKQKNSNMWTKSFVENTKFSTIAEWYSGSSFNSNMIIANDKPMPIRYQDLTFDSTTNQYILDLSELNEPNLPNIMLYYQFCNKKLLTVQGFDKNINSVITTANFTYGGQHLTLPDESTIINN